MDPATIAKTLSQANAIFGPFFAVLGALIKLFWWAPLPFILFGPLKKWYLRYKQEIWVNKIKFTVLELKIPRGELKPIKAMENVFAALWGTYDAANPKEKWFEGKILLGFSLEMVSTEGFPHFYIRVNDGVRRAVESAFYSQFPGIEIAPVEDYTKAVPPGLPNKDWDLWGCDYRPAKDDVYPIKTYRQFFEEKEGLKDEKQIDPLASLMEGMVRLGKGEHLWIQFMPKPITVKEDDYVQRGKEIIRKLIGRPDKAPPGKTLAQEAFNLAVFGTIPGAPVKNGEKPVIPVEMKLTPGEREVVQAIEQKISKLAFSTNVRFIYLAKKESFIGASKVIPFSLFSQFGTQHLNGLSPWAATITKIQAPDIFTKPRTFVRKRQMFKNYVEREDVEGSRFLLNIEELATMFHFPSVEAVPGTILPRVETKKGSPPMELPVE